MNFEFIRYKKGLRIYKPFTEAWLAQLILILKKEKALKDKLNTQELSLVFVSQKKSKKLNNQYRGKNKPTDVLSFEGDGVWSLGELLICLDEVKKKANASHLSYKIYLQLLVTHGVLHLLGYDHEQKQEAEQMFALQNKIIKKVSKKLAPQYVNDLAVELC